MLMGFREGKGTLNYSTGDKFTGDWKEDLRHGKGSY